MKKIFFLSTVLATGVTIFSQTPLQKFEFVSFSKVNITDNFWKPKIDNVATKTLEACIYQTETKTARIRNFEKVARRVAKNMKVFFMTTAMCIKHWKQCLTR